MATSHLPTDHTIDNFYLSSLVTQAEMLFHEHRLTHEGAKGKLMRVFIPEMKQNQIDILKTLAGQVYGLPSFAPPEYFYIRNQSLFNKRVENFSKEGLRMPAIFPVMGIQKEVKREEMLRNPDIVSHRLWLLKPMIYANVGNSRILENRYLHPLSPDVKLNDLKHEHTAYYHDISPHKPDMSIIGDFYSRHDVRSDSHLISTTMRPIFTEVIPGKDVGAQLVRTADILQHPDVQIFKEYWPIFDWDNVGRHHFKRAILPTSL